MEKMVAAHNLIAEWPIGNRTLFFACRATGISNDTAAVSTTYERIFRGVEQAVIEFILQME